MSSFNVAVDILFSAEGGYVNNPHDKGGSTKYGISQRFLDLIHDDRNIEDLTQDDCKELYKQYFWVPNHLSMITNQVLANKIFDMVVNMGVHAAIKIAQRACNQVFLATKEVSSPALTLDGIMGANTLQFINILPFDSLIRKIRELSVQYYEDIVDGDPSQKVFLDGWLTRANR